MIYHNYQSVYKIKLMKPVLLYANIFIYNLVRLWSMNIAYITEAITLCFTLKGKLFSTLMNV